jgi:hypothetical protein
MSRPPSASLNLRLRVIVRRSRCIRHELPDQAAFFTAVRQRLPLEKGPDPVPERSDDGQLPGANAGLASNAQREARSSSIARPPPPGVAPCRHRKTVSPSLASFFRRRSSCHRASCCLFRGCTSSAPEPSSPATARRARKEAWPGRWVRSAWRSTKSRPTSPPLSAGSLACGTFGPQ